MRIVKISIIALMALSSAACSASVSRFSGGHDARMSFNDQHHESYAGRVPSHWFEKAVSPVYTGAPEEKEITKANDHACEKHIIRHTSHLVKLSKEQYAFYKPCHESSFYGKLAKQEMEAK